MRLVLLYYQDSVFILYQFFNRNFQYCGKSMKVPWNLHRFPQCLPQWFPHLFRSGVSETTLEISPNTPDIPESWKIFHGMSRELSMKFPGYFQSPSSATFPEFFQKFILRTAESQSEYSGYSAVIFSMDFPWTFHGNSMDTLENIQTGLAECQPRVDEMHCSP